MNLSCLYLVYTVLVNFSLFLYSLSCKYIIYIAYVELFLYARFITLTYAINTINVQSSVLQIINFYFINLSLLLCSISCKTYEASVKAKVMLYLPIPLAFIAFLCRCCACTCGHAVCYCNILPTIPRYLLYAYSVHSSVVTEFIYKTTPTLFFSGNG